MLVFGFLLSFYPGIGQSVTFSDQTQKLRYIMGTMAQAKCGVDINGDFLDDITRVGPNGLHLEFQQPDGSFLYRFIPQSIEVLPVWSICAGDLDQDGYNDLVFGGGSNVSFLLSSANATAFEESVMPDFIYSQRSTLFDMDTDGDLDAFVCRDDGISQSFRNDGAGKMALDQSLINTGNLPGNYSAIWTDYDNDGHTDLYISKCLANALPGNPARTNLLFHNNGNGTFTERGAQAGLDDNAQSWSTAFEDFDNDGDFDAFVVNHDEENRLFRNNGDGTFTNVIADSGIDALDLGAFENASGDFNNDGFIDIISELRNELYLGKGDLTFTPQTLPFTPGAIGDFNNDGFLDVTYRSQLWINDGNENHWLTLNLLGLESNLNGIGARVELHGSWGVQVRELRSGESYSPMNSLNLHFGLGQANLIDKLVVKWPRGTVTEVFNLVADTTYLIPEAPCILAAEPLSISGNTALCPGDSVTLSAPPGYAYYEWPGGSTGAEIQADKPGIYKVVYIDSSGCAGVSFPVEITLADALLPEITILSGEAQNCEGSEVILQSTTGTASHWSNGVEGTDVISLTSTGIYTVSRDSVCGDGQFVSAPVSIEFLAAPAPQVDAVMIASGDSVLLMSSGEHCAWYDALTGGNLLSDECSFQTVPFFSDTVFYAENQYRFPGEIQSGGKPDDSGFNVLLPVNQAIHFTAFEPFTLLSTDMYVPDVAQEGLRTIQLRSGNTILAEKNVFLMKGKNEVELGFPISAGNYVLQCDRADQLQKVGALDYPYPLGDVGQLDSSSAGLNFYSYFFNWQIQKEEKICTSARTAVNIEVTGLRNSLSYDGVSLYPVPASTNLQIHFDQFPALLPEIQIRDFSGRLLSRQHLDHYDPGGLDVSQLPSGMYHLWVILKDSVIAMPFVVQR